MKFLILWSICFLYCAKGFVSNSPLSRIIGSQNATKHQFPYQVALRTKTGSYFSAGALISKDFVLTSSWSVRRNITTFAHVGLLNLKQNDSDVQVRKVIEFFRHPGGTFLYDIGLLRLEKPVTFTDAVKPVTLATGDECDALDSATFSGWGGGKKHRPFKHLQWLTLPLISLSECEERVNNVTDRVVNIPYNLSVCVGCELEEFEGGIGSDRGSPLYRDSIKKLIGIYSSWLNFELPTKPLTPSLFTNVCKMEEWIKEITNL